MQIVRDLGGYSLGRSDLVRRAMSKKKQSVMEKERANFINGNLEEGVCGCIGNGISEDIASKIYDNMMDFAKYAFNKSHGACYAVVAYQTAYLKYYYPLQFMAALLTSVIDHPNKVTEYIVCCRNMGIEILPPDINESGSEFSVTGKGISYPLLAIKSIGRPLIEHICKDRQENGKYVSLQEFLTRMQTGECHKRGVEHFIKSGALDCLGGTRKQFLQVYAQIMEGLASGKKNHIEGQMSLLDFIGEEEKKEFEIVMPDVGEYSKEELLTMEKEVLGIYVSGHPLESYMNIWKNNISATTADFMLDEETGKSNLEDNAKHTIGGLIHHKTIKYTKNDKPMAFVEVEDLYGTVEVIIFPRDYERNSHMLKEESKVFITGRVALEEDRNARLICEKITSFDDVGKKLWIRFETMKELISAEQELMNILADSEGKDQVVIFVAEGKKRKVLGAEYNVKADALLVEILSKKFGKNNIKVV